MMLKVLLVLCMCVATIKGQGYEGRKPPQLIPPLKCAHVACIQVHCANSYTPEGKCCPVCPPGDNCAHVGCIQVHCANSYTPAGGCCPICPPVNKCANIGCIQVHCANSYTPEGECCPVCPNKPPPINCNLVDCQHTVCPNPVIPTGQCCGVCQPNCANVACPLVSCTTLTVKLHGDCCQSCPPTPPTPDCSATLCLKPNCNNAITPKGECCAICPTPPPAPQCEYGSVGPCVGLHRVCPPGSNCHDGQCCRQRAVCIENGKTYQQGEDVPRGICDVCQCSSGGKVICAIIDCFPQPCSTGPLIQLPGKCCEECPVGCTVGGVTYNPGDIIPIANPCEFCVCTGDIIQCNVRPCPPPPNSCPNAIPPPGQCCVTECPATGGCIIKGISYTEGETIPDPDPCMFCRCSGGRKECASPGCILPICPNGAIATSNPGECCPTCPTPPTGCVWQSKSYPEGSNIPDPDPCSDCVCHQGQRQCNQKQCGWPFCGEGIQPVTAPGACCPGCPPIGCNVKGITYQEGETIPDPDPCKICRCMGGTKECATPKCLVPACPNGEIPIPKPGECCPTCPTPPTGCVWKGKSYPEGSDIPENDPCAGCRCYQGQRQCNQIFCDWPFCGEGIQPVTEPGACCPGCPTTGCVDNGINYAEGESIPDPNPCKFCSCMGGTKACAMPGCFVPTCPNGVLATSKPGECCPSCPTPPTGCVWKGKSYPEGSDMPDTDPCSGCRCYQGQKQCNQKHCGWPFCGEGIQPVTEPGACCPGCPTTGCFENGITYPVGAKIPGSDPCTFCECSNTKQKVCEMAACGMPSCPGGVAPIKKKGQCCFECPSLPPSPPIDCRLVRCAWPTCGPGILPSTKPGDCCPSCPVSGCNVNGKTYPEGATILDPNPCKSCHCSNGENICAMPSCAVPQCEGLVPATVRPGQCCPSCPPTEIGCRWNNKIYPEGGDLSNPLDPCNTCSCNQGERECFRKQCNWPICPDGATPSTKKGQCCPSCPPPTVSGCSHNYRAYREGEIIRDSSKPCSMCVCTGGQVVCEPIVCPRLRCRNPVQARGQCCKVCPNDGGYG